MKYDIEKSHPRDVFFYGMWKGLLVGLGFGLLIGASIGVAIGAS